MELSEAATQSALDRLQEEKMVWKVMGGRTVHFDHNLDAVWQLRNPEKALLTLLFLRGPQTAGELRGRSDRLHRFESTDAVEAVLGEMAAHSQPLLRKLPRRPGQKEERWAQVVGGDDFSSAATPAVESSSISSGEPLSTRVAHLEERVAAIEEALQTLKSQLGE